MWFRKEGQNQRNGMMLGQILSELNLLRRDVIRMSQQLVDLQNAVAANTASVTAAITTIGALENPAQLVPLTAAVTAASTALDAAVKAATPAPAA